MQIVWNEQRFAGELRTTDGDALEVVSPGTWNVAHGPDFKDASIRIAGRTHSGTVEVHRNASDWNSHGHRTDPRYSGVILHVVWRAPTPATLVGQPPCLAIEGLLDRPWQDLMDELQADVYPYARQVAPGSCAAQWAFAEDERLVRALRIAGLARFEDKTRRLRRAAIARGSGQALYEALFEALGYKANREPCRELCRHLPLHCLRELQEPTACHAVMLGAGGLLPDPSTAAVTPGLRAQLRQAWDLWWAQGRDVLPLRWSRSGVRPLNSPERRVAAGVALLAKMDWSPDAWLSDVADRSDSPRALLRRLESELTLSSPWEAHQDFCRPLAKPARLLGRDRIRDLLVNVVLPFLNAQAGRTEEQRTAELAKGAFLAVPALQDNRLLREAAHRFLVPPSRRTSLLRGACEQQGLIELYRSFCLPLHCDCENCPLVGGLPVEDSVQEE